MLGELMAITSAISAINQTISTFKEGRANAQEAAALLGKFSTTAQKLDDWGEKEKAQAASDAQGSDGFEHKT